MIADIGHVALQVPDVEACAEHARDVLGLRESARVGGAVHLTCDPVRARLTYLPGAQPALEPPGIPGPARTAQRRGIVEGRTPRDRPSGEPGQLPPTATFSSRKKGWSYTQRAPAGRSRGVRVW